MKRVRYCIVSLLLVLAATSCHDECIDTWGCGVTDPAEELLWLKERIDELQRARPTLTKYSYVQQAELKGQTVFVIDNCCPFCNSRPMIFNCAGEELAEQGIRSLIRNEKVVWKPADSECTL